MNAMTTIEETLSNVKEEIKSEIKEDAYYIFQHTGECEGSLTTPNVLLPLAYGSGAANEENFALFVLFKCTIDRIAMTSVFGENERVNPGLQVRIEIVYNGEILVTHIFPESGVGNENYHHGITNETTLIEVQQAGSFIYVYTSASNLLDDTARHRISFYFKNYYLLNE
jgi:hypothetical protein